MFGSTKRGLLFDADFLVEPSKVAEAHMDASGRQSEHTVSVCDDSSMAGPMYSKSENRAGLSRQLLSGSRYEGLFCTYRERTESGSP